MIEYCGTNENLWRIGMEFLAPRENRALREKLGQVQTYKINYAARRKSSPVSMEIADFIAKMGPSNTVAIAEALGAVPHNVGNRMGNLLARGIVVRAGSEVVQTENNHVRVTVWGLGPSYDEWRSAQGTSA